MNRADAAGNGQFLGPDLYFDDLFCMAAKRRFMSCERIVPTERAARTRARMHTLRINRMMVDGVVEAPLRRALHRVRARLRPRRELPARVRGQRPSPEAWRAFHGQIPAPGHDAYRSGEPR